MNVVPRLRWLATAVAPVALSVVAMATGCGKAGPERVPVFPVEGAVTFEGKPIPGAMIVLHPKHGASADLPTPRASVVKDGSFRFTTYDAGDGVPAGDYVATVAWYKLTRNGNEVQAGPNVLPPRYSNAMTSKWQIRVADAPVRLPDVKLRR